MTKKETVPSFPGFPYNMHVLVATWAIALATICTSIAAIYSLNAYRLSLTVDAAFKLESRFNEEKFRKLRSIAARALLDHKNEEEAEYIFDFFDSVGLFIRLGALRDEVVYSIFFHWINLYWRAGKHHIGARQKETSDVWKDFETLFHKVCEIERRRSPDSEDLKMLDDRLRSQLQDEIDLRPAGR